MRHKHADMIKAKAENMDLVIISRNEKTGVWADRNCQKCKFSEKFDYFLCLPQHKESCLHWLNGGKTQYKTELTPDWQDYQPSIEFGLGSVFMQDYFEIKIKPSKEKRWIGVNNQKNTTNAYKTKQEAMDQIISGKWQFIEIEIEV